jgi:prevent-host-death family protein
MPIEYTATEFRQHLNQALNQVAAGEGPVLITKHGRVIAALVGSEDLVQARPEPVSVGAVNVDANGAPTDEELVPEPREPNEPASDPVVVAPVKNEPPKKLQF